MTELERQDQIHNKPMNKSYAFENKWVWNDMNFFILYVVGLFIFMFVFYKKFTKKIVVFGGVC
jgi:hypothetical protein